MIIYVTREALLTKFSNTLPRFFTSNCQSNKSFSLIFLSETFGYLKLYSFRPKTDHSKQGNFFIVYSLFTFHNVSLILKSEQLISEIFQFSTVN